MALYFDIAAIGSRLADNTLLAEKACVLGVKDSGDGNQSVEDYLIDGVEGSHF